MSTDVVSDVFDRTATTGIHRVGVTPVGIVDPLMKTPDVIKREAEKCRKAMVGRKADPHRFARGWWTTVVESDPSLKPYLTAFLRLVK